MEGETISSLKAIIAAAFDRYAVGGTTLAGHLLDQLRPSMLCLADCAFVVEDETLLSANSCHSNALNPALP